MPELPQVPNVSYKSKASRVCPHVAFKHQISSECLDLPSVTASHAFESCVYIFIFPFIWQLVFFFITPGALNPVTISRKSHRDIKQQLEKGNNSGL